MTNPLLAATLLSMESGTFLEELHKAWAEEWENMTGAFETAMASFMVLIDTWDKSTMIPSLFISFTIS